MCGIAGVIAPSPEFDPAIVEHMVECLRHRGPDDSGCWQSGFGTADGRSFSVGLGHTRLSIIDLSRRSRQPMVSNDGRATVALNGEIYNYRELRRQLEDRGRVFRTSSDTEVLLEAWREWGADALPRLHGMFAFALWDRDRNRLLLVRDRLGIKPMCYAVRDEGLIFGSELGALRRHPRFAARIERAALGRFLRFGYLSGPETIYQDVRRLMPGEYLEWREGKLSRHAWWSAFDPEPEAPADLPAAAARLEQLLADSVTERLVADVPVGAFLSGGIDSSAVVAVMSEISADPVHTFSIGFRDRQFDEAPWARRVAAHLGTEHRELIVDRAQARGVLEQLPELYDEPFGDASAIPTTLVSRLARREVKVVLSGDGGDELFGGYSRYRRLQQLETALRLPRPVRGALAAAARLVPWRPLRSGARLLQCASPGEAAHAATERFPADLVAACCGERAALPRAEFLSAFERAPAGGLAKRAMFADVRTYLVDDILAKLDRASMSVALEARVPLLDHRLVRFALSLPLELLWQKGESKSPLRAMLYRRVPERLLARPKRGFGFPVAELLGADLDRWVEHYLAPVRLAEEGLMDPAAVARLVARTDRRSRSGVKGLWHLICFERWYARVHRGERDP